MIGVILAAGDGTRLKDSSNSYCCKPLTKIKGKPLIEYSLDNLVSLGIHEAYIVIGKEGSLIQNQLGNKYKSINLHYVCQAEQCGLINAFIQAVRVINPCEDVLLQLSDEVFKSLKLDKINAAINPCEADFYCGVAYEDEPQKIKNNFSVEFDDSLTLITCTEKPTVVTNNVKGTGFCVFGSSALDFLRSIYNEATNTPKDLCDYMNLLTQNNKTGTVLFIADKEFNVNTLLDLNETDSFDIM